MRIKAFLVFLFILLSTPTVHAKTVIYDPGGWINPRWEKVLQLRKSGEEVKIYGWCASACTFYIWLPRKQVCVGRFATFGFHQAWLRPFPFYKPAPEGTRHMWTTYPDWVKEWLNERGGLTRGMKIMPNSYIRKHMRKCGE